MPSTGAINTFVKLKYFFSWLLVFCLTFLVGNISYSRHQEAVERVTFREVAFCQEISNVAFIKTHKTGSTTLRVIINRFGLSRNLSFMHLNESKGGHVRYLPLDEKLRRSFLPPFGVRTGDYENYEGYNISTVHIRFSMSFFQKIMARETKYVTIVRDPVDQWLSAVTFFNFKKYLPSRFTNLMTEPIAWELAQKPNFYRKKMRGNDPYYFQNNQAFDLGLSYGNCRNSSAIKRYVEFLDTNIDLVLINEYFDESLLLMRKMFCWSWTDIVYISVNQQSRGHAVKNDTLKELVRKNNKADQYIYNYFNESLWKRIQQYGANFRRDLEFFRRLRENTNKKCLVEDIVVQGKLIHKPRTNTSELCRALVNQYQIQQIAAKQIKSGLHINWNKHTVMFTASSNVQTKKKMNETLGTEPLLKDDKISLHIKRGHK